MEERTLRPITLKQRRYLTTLIPHYRPGTPMPATMRDAQTLISAILVDAARWDRKATTIESILCEHLYRARGDQVAAEAALLPYLQSDAGPRFTERTGGGARRVVDPDTARVMLRAKLSSRAITAQVERALKADAERPPEPAPEPPQPDHGDDGHDPRVLPPAPEPEPPSRNGNPSTRQDAARDYVTWSQSVRAYCDSRAADGHKLDDWSLRPTLDGVRLILAGCDPAVVRDAATMHFPQDARQRVRVKEANPRDVLAYLALAAESRKIGTAGAVPMMLVGPKGTGKSTLAMQLAERLDLPFGMVSMTAGTPPSAFYGRPKIGGDGSVVESRFVAIYRGGGVFLFDEMDAADPNILLIVNAALANGHFDNPSTGEQVTKHPDFIPLAAANTLGLGGSRDYTGRDRLDAATLDRFGAGRVRVKIDAALESRLADELIAL